MITGIDHSDLIYVALLSNVQLDCVSVEHLIQLGLCEFRFNLKENFPTSFWES